MRVAYRKLLLAIGLGSTLHTACIAQLPSDTEAPAGTLMQRVWHLGRTTGDLERIMQFYVDLLGLGLRGERNAPIPFYTVDTINEFVGGPQGAEFRAAFMPIPGTSAATEPGEQIYLEAFEYRHVDRDLRIPALVDIGVSNLRFIVRDLDALVAAATTADVAFISSGKQAVTISTPPGYSGTARAVMLRDPDGYPVELVEISPTPASFAAADSRIVGAQMVVVVANLEESLALYRDFVGMTQGVPGAGAWQPTGGLSALRNIPNAEYRSAALLLPGSTVELQLLEFRGVEQKSYRPVFQDIGFGHVAFLTGNIEAVHAQMNALDMRSVSSSGTWTQINAGTRAIYTRDHDGFFMEVIERR